MKIGSSAWNQAIVDGAATLGIPVSPRQVEQFARHADLLLEWNRTINLTAIVNPLEVAVKHYLDAIISIAYIPRRGRLLDVGSGAGFPGIPLKIMLPSLRVTLVEATRKKVHFLKHVIRELDLKDIEAIHSRIENYRQICRVAFNVVVSRAFSDLSGFVQLSLPYLAEQGWLIAYKARGAADEIAGLQPVLTPRGKAEQSTSPESGFAVKSVSFTLPICNLSRTLILLQPKTRPHEN